MPRSRDACAAAEATADESSPPLRSTAQLPERSSRSPHWRTRTGQRSREEVATGSAGSCHHRRGAPAIPVESIVTSLPAGTRWIPVKLVAVPGGYAIRASWRRVSRSRVGRDGSKARVPGYRARCSVPSMTRHAMGSTPTGSECRTTDPSWSRYQPDSPPSAPGGRSTIRGSWTITAGAPPGPGQPAQRRSR
jgi:hypothetical protein